MNGKAPPEIFSQVQEQCKPFKEIDPMMAQAAARRLWNNGRATIILNREQDHIVLRYDERTGRVIRV